MAKISGIPAVAPAVGLAAHLGRGFQRVATDALLGGLRSFPRRVADLDAAVLSGLTGKRVTSVSVIGGDSGTSSRARLALIAYTLITSMTTTDRQTSERELLEEYSRALSAAGGPELDRDELWERYRMAALYAYVAPLITAGMGGMQAENIALEGVRRGVAALEDLETVALLEKSLR